MKSKRSVGLTEEKVKFLLKETPSKKMFQQISAFAFPQIKLGNTLTILVSGPGDVTTDVSYVNGVPFQYELESATFELLMGGPASTFSMLVNGVQQVVNTGITTYTIPITTTTVIDIEFI